MSLNPQTQCLKSLNKLESTERVETGAQITKNLNAHVDGEGERAEGLPEIEPVVAFTGFGKLGVAGRVLAPVEFPTIDDYAADRGTVATDPFCGGADDDVGA